MSVVTVQVGQCGNQLGASLFDTLHAHASQQETSAAADAADGDTAAVAAAASACRRSFFRDGGVARAIIIDTEPKVIQRIVDHENIDVRPKDSRVASHTHTDRHRRGRSSKGSSRSSGIHSTGGHKIGGAKPTWRYDSNTQVCCHAQGGAANNWAYGYFAHGAAASEACLESVRRETERCDRLTGICMLHSAAGGTGSGLGTYLTEVKTCLQLRHDGKVLGCNA